LSDRRRNPLLQLFLKQSGILYPSF
jgi:hypothetical protein